MAPSRSESSLRRGILHNALQRDDGSWVWRYARFRGDDQSTDRGGFLDLLKRLGVPAVRVPRFRAPTPTARSRPAR